MARRFQVVTELSPHFISSTRRRTTNSRDLCFIGTRGHKVKYYQSECKVRHLFGEDFVVKVISEANEGASMTVKYQ